MTLWGYGIASLLETLLAALIAGPLVCFLFMSFLSSLVSWTVSGYNDAPFWPRLGYAMRAFFSPFMVVHALAITLHNHLKEE